MTKISLRKEDVRLLAASGKSVANRASGNSSPSLQKREDGKALSLNSVPVLQKIEDRVNSGSHEPSEEKRYGQTQQGGTFIEQLKSNRPYAGQSHFYTHPVAQLTAKETTPSTPKWEDNDNSGLAGAPEIQNKSGHSNEILGTQPSAFPTGWTDVLTKAPKVKGAWVRFHLINEHLGGSGKKTSNLVPTEHAVNTGSKWKNFETDVKNYFNNKKWIWCRTTVTYDNSYPAGFPKTIVGEAQWYDDSGKSWKNTNLNGTQLDISSPQFGSGVKTRTLDEMTANTWSLVTGLKVGTKIVTFLNKLGSETSDIDEFNKALYSINAPNIPDYILNNIDYAIKGNHKYVNIVVSY